MNQNKIWKALVLGFDRFAALKGMIWGIFVAITLLCTASLFDTIDSCWLQWQYQFFRRTQVDGKIVLVGIDDSCTNLLPDEYFSSNSLQEYLCSVIGDIKRSDPKLIVLSLDPCAGQHATRRFIELINEIPSLVISYEEKLIINAYSAELLANAKAGDTTLHSDRTYCRLPIYRMHHERSRTTAPLAIVAAQTLGQTSSSDSLGRFFLADSKNVNFNHSLKTHPGNLPYIPIVRVKENAFRDQIVMIGWCRPTDSLMTPIGLLSPLTIQAHALLSVLNNELLSELNYPCKACLFVVFGAGMSTLFTFGPPSKRLLLVAMIGIAYVILVVLLNQLVHLIIPISMPLLLIAACYLIATWLVLQREIAELKQKVAIDIALQTRTDKERQRIAIGLHNEILPEIRKTMRLADGLKKIVPSSTVPSEIRETLEQATSGIRQVLEDLYPSVLRHLGLVSAIEELHQKVIHSMEIEGDFSDLVGTRTIELTDHQKISIYRVLQECFNNIERHSRATQVEVTISLTANRLCIGVTDNGIGISNSSNQAASSLGLHSMRRLAESIDAKLSIGTPKQYSSGTTVQLIVPLR